MLMHVWNEHFNTQSKYGSIANIFPDKSKPQKFKYIIVYYTCIEKL